MTASPRKRLKGEEKSSKGVERNVETLEIKFISSEEVFNQNIDIYLKDPSVVNQTLKKISILFPNGCKEIYPFVSPNKDGYDPIEDILKSFHIILTDLMNYFPGIVNIDILDTMREGVREEDYEKCFHAVTKLSEAIESLRARKMISTFHTFSFEQTVCLLDQIYERAVVDPDSLRKYKGFSKEVYGETGYGIINDLLKELNVTDTHIFVDLGSGIGNVVLQVSAQTRCKAYGIELLDTPATYATNQLNEFNKRCKMYCREEFDIKLFNGDFLEHSQIHKIIEISDFVFVNNFAFESSLNQRYIFGFNRLELYNYFWG
jgi:hypothetical protein